MSVGPAPLTVGTAGHVDHGKTALVRALTGVDTDRLPEERRRGLTIVLGFAPLRLPGGRLLSLVDVPGHERLVRVMVSGASGIDLFLLVVAADDGIMPQTVEHMRVLDALGVRRGVVAVTKSDLVDPGATLAQVRTIAPGIEAIACSASTGAGLPELADALERLAVGAPSRARRAGPAVLHIDRCFTIHGAGTVVTGTLWQGTLTCGDRVTVLPSALEARVRGLQVHDRSLEFASAGQRVAVNLGGVRRDQVRPGDVISGRGAALHVARRIEAELRLYEPLQTGDRVSVHHGTRGVPARALDGADGRWELRCERPLIVAEGDRIVVRRQNPPVTLGGGAITRLPRADAGAGAAGDRRRAAAIPKPVPAPEPVALSEAALELERELRRAGHEPPADAELGALAGELPVLVASGRAIRIGRAMHAHPDAIARVQSVVERLIEAEGQVTLARLRDELQTSRKYAQALLEHLDAARVTRRREDNSRVLRRRSLAA